MSLSKEQQQFVEAKGKIILSACPGSGKTYALTQKIRHHLKDWQFTHKGIAALSFTNVASDEVKKQLTSMNCESYINSYPHFVGTIDSFFNQNIFLRFSYLLTKTSKKPKIILDDINFPFKYWRRECRQTGCVEEISTFRFGIDGNTYKNDKQIDCQTNYYGRPCDQYKKLLMKKGVYFQNDIATLCWHILEKYPDIAEIISSRYPVMLIDEAQDSSKEQMEVLKKIAKVNTDTFCMVGDPDQAIYQWRGASPDEFIALTHDNSWKVLYLNENRRSSQHICNATKQFSIQLDNSPPNIAVGEHQNFSKKPELIFYSLSCDNSYIYQYFQKKCEELEISKNQQSQAVLTRARVNKGTTINGLWKSVEIKNLAKACYHWHHGSRKKAYRLCEESLFMMLIADISEMPSSSIELEELLVVPYDIWKKTAQALLFSLPNEQLSLFEWCKQLLENLEKINYPLPFRKEHDLAKIIKVKTRDKNNPGFKTYPLISFFMEEVTADITYSTVHGVKGETFDAILLLVTSTKGQTLTPSLLVKGDLSEENMRIAYVAMTRPRKYLAVAMPLSKKTPKELARFPTALWEYVYL